MSLVLFVLLLASLFQLKHFLADFPLQGEYMLGKFKEHPHYILPLLCHSGVHALMTLAISFVVSSNLYLSIGLAMMDMTIHFVVDRIKVVKGRGLNPQQKSFWNLIGLDQMAHHLTHYLIIYILILTKQGFPVYLG